MSKQRPSAEERLRNIQQGFFGKNRELKEVDPIEPTPMLVPLERIRPYDRNPRQEPNEAYDLIKQSISSRGFTGSLPITRRPHEPDYMVAEGGNTVLQIVKELYAETGDPRFKTIHCLFEPWVSESETLIAHLIENDARGELIFIDRARAIHQLRELMEHETGAPLTATRLAAVLRERGYAIDQPAIVRLEYAIERLFAVMPVALRSGVGRPVIDRIRKLDGMLEAFLEDRKCDQVEIKKARRWFLACLGRHDREDWLIEPIEYELEAYLAELCGESIAKVRADLDFIEQHGGPGQDAPPALRVTLPERRSKSSRASPNAVMLGDKRAGAESPGSERSDAQVENRSNASDAAFDLGDDTSAEMGPSVPPSDLPQDVKSLRGRMWTLASQLAQRHGLGECVLTCAKGCGFLVDLPEHPPFAGDGPASAKEVQGVMLWWMLAGLADEWPDGPGVAPALALLEEARIYPAIKAVAEGDEITPTRTLVPRVGFPPSLAIAPRELLAVLDERDYARLVQLIDARRALQAHCRRLGKAGVWAL